MNLRGGKALISRLWMSFFASRGFMWSLALGHLMPTLIYMFVWITAASQSSLGGFNRDEFVVYYLAMMILHELTYAGSSYSVGWAIRSGGFSAWLLRPIPPIYEAVGMDFAGKGISLPFTILTALILGLILQPAVHLAPGNILLFFLAVIMAYVLRFFLDYIQALLAFWTQRLDALMKINDTLLFLFGGQVAPFALLPHTLQAAAAFLPYRYMLGFPVEVLLDRLPPEQAREGFLGLGIWILVTILLHRIVWKRGLRHYTAVGG